MSFHLPKAKTRQKPGRKNIIDESFQAPNRSNTRERIDKIHAEIARRRKLAAEERRTKRDAERSVRKEEKIVEAKKKAAKQKVLLEISIKLRSMGYLKTDLIFHQISNYLAKCFLD